MARPTQAWELPVLTRLLNRIYQTCSLQATIGFSNMMYVMCMYSFIISVKQRKVLGTKILSQNAIMLEGGKC